MIYDRTASVAVLLATHNGARYIWPQLHSLRDNVTKFTLHWLDDHSTDVTADAVRACARNSKLTLREYHLPSRVGLPKSFFSLLEMVDADIYLFCDQDDIWQPGKIDAVVESLLPQIGTPALSFTDIFTFQDSQPGLLKDPLSAAEKEFVSEAVRRSAIFAFLPGAASAQTQGFTRSLRDLFLEHKEIAASYAAMHDWWMYDIAVASGEVARLDGAPRALYRYHSDSYCASLLQTARRRLRTSWHRGQLLRRITARHARGLLEVSTKLPPGERLSRMLGYARLVATLDTPISLASVVKLSRMGLRFMDSPLFCLASMLTQADVSTLEKDATASGLLVSADVVCSDTASEECRHAVGADN